LNVPSAKTHTTKEALDWHVIFNTKWAGVGISIIFLLFLLLSVTLHNNTLYATSNTEQGTGQ